MVKYWSTKKPKAVIENQRADLKLWLDFVNTDMPQAKKQFLQLKERILYNFMQNERFFPNKPNWKPTEEITDEIIKAIQRHLHSRLKVIVGEKMGIAEMAMWSVTGAINLSLVPLEKRFRIRLQVQKILPCIEIENSDQKSKQTIVENPHEIETLWFQTLDLWLLEIFLNMSLNSRRFGKCPRCSNFFYSSTDKEKIYCSTRCSSAVRQEKFLEKRRGEDE